MANNRIQYDLMFQSAKQCNGPDESMRDLITFQHYRRGVLIYHQMYQSAI